MKYLIAILTGVAVYLGLYFGEKGVHFLYFYLTHDFATSNILMIKSSFMIASAAILGGGIAGYLCQRGLSAGFLVGVFAGLGVLVFQQLTGANPLFQDFTPAILFDEVFLKGCYCAVSGAAGELIYRRK